MNRIKINTNRVNGWFQFRINRKWFCGWLSGRFVWVYHGSISRIPMDVGNKSFLYDAHIPSNKHLIEKTINDNMGLLFDPLAWSDHVTNRGHE